jgi:hypothetical protein
MEMESAAAMSKRILTVTDSEIEIVKRFFDLFAGFSASNRAVIIDELVKADSVGLRAESDRFYESDEWRQVRYLALKNHDGRCQCCGQRPTPGNPLHVDHIKPRSLFPAYALAVNNLQVLCADCNLGKSNLDQTDWRR